MGASLIVGGVDATGPQLYSVHPHGSYSRLPFTALGERSRPSPAALPARLHSHSVLISDIPPVCRLGSGCCAGGAGGPVPAEHVGAHALSPSGGKGTRELARGTTSSSLKVKGGASVARREKGCSSRLGPPRDGKAQTVKVRGAGREFGVGDRWMRATSGMPRTRNAASGCIGGQDLGSLGGWTGHREWNHLWRQLGEI